MEAKLIISLLFLVGVSSFPFHLAVTSSNYSNAGDKNLSISANEDPKGFCPPGWVITPSKSKCFKYVGGLHSWNYSESHCKGDGGHLAVLTSFQDVSFVRKVWNQSVSGCWVGGRGQFGSTGLLVWNWSDGKSKWNDSLLVKQPSLSKCHKQPCYSNTTEFCALLSSASQALVGELCDSSHAYLCMRDVESKCYHMRCHREYLIVLAVVSGLILSTTTGVIMWLLVYKRNKKWRRSRRLASPSSLALVPPSWRVFTKEELKGITKNFSEGCRLLGDAKTGGTCYGLLPDGSRVAVKRLKRSSVQRKKEFFSEVGRVAKLHHPNLVAIKGCCYDHGDRYIIFDFIAQGPLDRWLHHVPRGGRTLDWAIRLQIAINLAQGIAFLHDNVKPQVVHQDIRASNVLLDEEFGAHLMGVGLSKFVPWEVMHERTVMAGVTYGYLAPEFVYRNELTTKSDVYSFGVLLLEIVSGRRPAEAVESVGWQSIFEWATPLVQAHRYTELLDPLITSSSTSVIPDHSVIQKEAKRERTKLRREMELQRMNCLKPTLENYDEGPLPFVCLEYKDSEGVPQFIPAAYLGKVDSLKESKLKDLVNGSDSFILEEGNGDSMEAISSYYVALGSDNSWYSFTEKYLKTVYKTGFPNVALAPGDPLPREIMTTLLDKEELQWDKLADSEYGGLWRKEGSLETWSWCLNVPVLSSLSEDDEVLQMSPEYQDALDHYKDQRNRVSRLKKRIARTEGFRVYKSIIKAAQFTEEKIERLKSRSQRLTNRIEQIEPSGWREFLQVGNVIHESRALDINTHVIFPLGETASAIRGENELWLAMVLRSKILLDLKPAQLAAVCGSIVSEGIKVRPWKNNSYIYEPSTTVLNVIDFLEEQKTTLLQLQEKHGVNIMCCLDSQFSGMVEAWASGLTWKEIMMDCAMDEGDLARLLRRTIDLLAQIPKLPDIDPLLQSNAKKASDVMDRPPISELAG